MNLKRNLFMNLYLKYAFTVFNFRERVSFYRGTFAFQYRIFGYNVKEDPVWQRLRIEIKLP